MMTFATSASGSSRGCLAGLSSAAMAASVPAEPFRLGQVDVFMIQRSVKKRCLQVRTGATHRVGKL
jgi:hypothetical protein